MKTLKGWTAAVAALALALAAQAGAAGPTTVSNTYPVGGLSIPGASTGLVLTGAMTVTVTASGAVCPYAGFCPGPNGYTLWDTAQSSYGGFPLPGGPAWGLVGRVGNGSWVQIGTGPKKLSGTGELVFAINDDLLSDNTGSFTVTVSYTCWPGWGWGDKNHTHCGPPGLVGKSSPSAANAPNGGKGNGAADTAPNGNGKGHGPVDTAPNGNGNTNGDGNNGNTNGNGNGNANGNGNGVADTGPNGNGKGNGLAKH